jgi:fatty-acyl-CoA synthase
MARSIAKLYRAGILKPVGLLRAIASVVNMGTNLMVLLQFAAKLYPHRVAVIDEDRSLSYRELSERSYSLAVSLHDRYHIDRRYKVAIICVNHSAIVQSIFAVSRLGADVFLLNPEMSGDRLLESISRLQFDFIIYDERLTEIIHAAGLAAKSLPAYHPTAPSIDSLAATQRTDRLKPRVNGKLVVMTGGTTGLPKTASRRPTLMNFLPPFIALVDRINLDLYRSVYVATPIYHGFGLATLFIGVVLGSTMYFRRKFDAVAACELINKHQIEVITVVPLMLQRMLDRRADLLTSLQRIVSGGAMLPVPLARTTIDRLGKVLFNLYGTSEAGFCIMATPDLLARKPDSIGQPIWGVRASILDRENRPVTDGSIGRLCIASAWTVDRHRAIESGDLAYYDAEGDLFLCGRSDDMVVSGGENVYPIDLERALLQHADIAAVAVIGIDDPEFGQRLKAFIVLQIDRHLDEPTLRDWLKPRIARYQMPAAIVFLPELPYTSLGKIDKKSLRER